MAQLDELRQVAVDLLVIFFYYALDHLIVEAHVSLNNLKSSFVYQRSRLFN